jgi:hypothetical protein
MYRLLPLFFLIFGFEMAAEAQENSPYSRYGLGDIVPNRNIMTRGMGGISAGVFDYQSINFTNPAALGGIKNTIFDIGTEADVRVLKNTSPALTSTSANAIFSYLQLGVPLTSKAMKKKNVNWGMTFGLRPYSNISYKIENNQRLSGIDSLNTIYQGTGGVNQLFLGTGFKFTDIIGNHTNSYSFGVNLGYLFGSKNYSTVLTFINDSVDYYRSNSANNTHFGGLFVNGGFQFESVSKARTIRLGVYGSIQERLNATQDILREIISYDANGNPYRVDSVSDQQGVSGTIIFPSTIGTGFTYQDDHWLYGADFEITNWNNYQFFESPDDLQSSWVARAGVQYFPAKDNTPAKKYWSFVRYRAGIFYGPDYIKVTTNRPVYGFTLGTGMPLTSLRRFNPSGERATLNTAIEIGGRGDKSSNIRETTVRFSVGLSLNASWFIKRKYD